MICIHCLKYLLLIKHIGQNDFFFRLCAIQDFILLKENISELINWMHFMLYSYKMIDINILSNLYKVVKIIKPILIATI